MHRASLLLVIFLIGCTHVQLTSSTANTASTVMEIQYQMVMDNLARMARNPATLPSQIRIKQGTVQVSDQLGIYQLEASGSLSGTFGGPRAERTVSEQWGADAISDPRAIKELQDIYRASMQLPPLSDPSFLAIEKAEEARRNFSKGESDGGAGNGTSTIDLRRDVPQGWFHVGVESQVPEHAAYVSHSGKHWVWVTQDNLDGLSRFTLVILFITKLGPGERNSTGPGLMYTAGGK